MKKTMIETFKIMDVFEMFNKYKEEGPKCLADMDWFIPACKENGYTEVSEFLEEWTAIMNYHVEREHDPDD